MAPGRTKGGKIYIKHLIFLGFFVQISYHTKATGQQPELSSALVSTSLAMRTITKRWKEELKSKNFSKIPGD